MTGYEAVEHTVSQAEHTASMQVGRRTSNPSPCRSTQSLNPSASSELSSEPAEILQSMERTRKPSAKIIEAIKTMEAIAATKKLRKGQGMGSRCRGGSSGWYR